MIATADFGSRKVPLADKQAMVDDVFRSVARRYDLMNDLMSFGLHRGWKDALVNAVNPPKQRPFALLDLAGGTGDIAFRVVNAGGAGTQATVCDINADMLAVGRERAQALGVADRVGFWKRTPKSCRSPTAASTPSPLRSASATCRASSARSPKRFRVLKIGGQFLCLEFSAVDVPGLDRLYDLYSFNVIPALGRMVAGDAESYRYLVESIRRFPQPPEFRRHAARRRICARVVSDHERRDRGAASGLAPVIAGPAHLVRLGRAGFVFAREGVLGLIDPAMLPAPARAALRLARVFERPSDGAAATRLSTALSQLGPSYVKLGQFLATRPDVVGTVLARDLERLQDQMPPFPQQEAEAAVAASFGKPLGAVFASFGPAVAAASIAQVHRAEIDTPAGRRTVAVKVLRPGVEQRFRADLQSFTYVARHAENFSAEARRLRLVEVVDTLRRSVALEMDFRLEAAASSEMAGTPRPIQTSASRRSIGTAPPRKC